MLMERQNIPEVQKMACFSVEEMQCMQRELQEKYRHKWPEIAPAEGRSKLLWMMSEAGEAADVIKKKGDQAIMEDQAVRSHFVEEMCDVLMYFNDVMLCYSISPEELAHAYREKHQQNMARW